MSTGRIRALALVAAVVLSACGSRTSTHIPPPELPRVPTLRPATTTAAEPATRPVPRDAVLSPPGAVPADAAPRWALVVGVDDYPGERNDLSTAVDDARTMVRALRALGFRADHIRTLIGAEATAAAVLDGARWLADRTTTGSTGVFLFAGHARQVGDAADGDPETVDEALVGSDFENLADGALAAALRPARGALWLVFATCNAAGFDDAAAPGRVLSFASGEDEPAYESAKLGASFFIEFAVRRAILREGISSAEAAVRHGWVAMRGGFREYRPQQIDLHPGPLVLTPVYARTGA